MSKAFLLLIAAALLSACTTLKSQCEATDWYAYGHSAAMEGRRLSGDNKVRRCQNVDADVDVDEVALDHGFKEGMSNYCRPETVYITGKKGQFFNEDMCDGSKSLAKRHEAGVLAFCQRENAYPAGATGEKYNGICPSKLEKNFLPEFNRGRRSFIEATIASNEMAINDLERSISGLVSYKMMAQSRLMMLPNETRPAQTLIDPRNGAIQIVQPQGPDPAVMSQRMSINSEISNYDSQISSAQYKVQQLREINRAWRVEATTL